MSETKQPQPKAPEVGEAEMAEAFTQAEVWMAWGLRAMNQSQEEADAILLARAVLSLRSEVERRDAAMVEDARVISRLQGEVERLRNQIDAWYEAFGTTQLSHALARLTAAEEAAARNLAAFDSKAHELDALDKRRTEQIEVLHRQQYELRTSLTAAEEARDEAMDSFHALERVEEEQRARALAAEERLKEAKRINELTTRDLIVPLSRQITALRTRLSEMEQERAEAVALYDHAFPGRPFDAGPAHQRFGMLLLSLQRRLSEMEGAARKAKVWIDAQPFERVLGLDVVYRALADALNSSGERDTVRQLLTEVADKHGHLLPGDVCRPGTLYYRIAEALGQEVHPPASSGEGEK